MYKYNICNVADYDIYKRQCAALEKNIPGLANVEELHDVDDGRYMTYSLNGKRICVKNSVYLDIVCVESEIPLEHYFKK